MDIIFKFRGFVVNYINHSEKYKTLIIGTGKELYGGKNCEIAAKFNASYKADIWSKLVSNEIFAGDEVEAEVELTGKAYDGKWYNDLDLRNLTLIRKANQTAQAPQMQQPPQQMQQMQQMQQQAPMCPPFGTPESLHFERTLNQWVVWNQQARVWGFLHQPTGHWLGLQANTLADFVPAQQHQMSQQMGQGGGIPQGYVNTDDDQPF